MLRLGVSLMTDKKIVITVKMVRKYLAKVPFSFGNQRLLTL